MGSTIIQCEKCLSKFRLDEKLIAPNGSKVRCSLCRHVFMALPSAPFAPAAEDSPAPFTFDTEGPGEEEAAAEQKAEPSGPASKYEEDIDFDNLFERAYQDETPPPEEEYPQDDDDAGQDVAAVDDWDSPDDETAAEPVRRPRRRRSLPIILVILVLLLGAAGAVWFFAPQYIPAQLAFLKTGWRQPEDKGNKNLALVDVSGRFIDSKTAGSLFVINGAVINKYPSKRSFILVRGSILDDAGKALATREAYAGNPFSADELQSMTLEEIAEGMRNQYGIGRNNFNIEPDTAVPFTIVLDSLPENMKEFTVEPVSSAPGM